MASLVVALGATPSSGLMPAEPRYSANKKVRAHYVSIITRFPQSIEQAEFHERIIRAPDSCRASDQAPVTHLGNPLLHNLPRPHKSEGIDLANHLDQHNRAFFLTKGRNCNVRNKRTTSFWSDFRAFYGYYQARPTGKKTIFMPMCHVIPVCNQGDCLTKLKRIGRDRFNEEFENLFSQYHRIDATKNVSKAAIFEAVGRFKQALTYCGVCRTKWHSSQHRQASAFRAHLNGTCMSSLFGPTPCNEGELENEESEQADNEGSTPLENEGRTHSEEVFKQRRILAWEKLRRGLDAGEDWSPAQSPAAPAESPGTNVPVRDENTNLGLSGPSGPGSTAVSSASHSEGQLDNFTPPTSPTSFARIPRTPNMVSVSHSLLDALGKAQIANLDGSALNEATRSNSQQGATGEVPSGESGTLIDLDDANSSAPASVPLEQVTSVTPFPNNPKLPKISRSAPANALGHNKNPWGSKRSHRKSQKRLPNSPCQLHELPAVTWHYPCTDPHCGTCVPCYGTIRSRGGWTTEASAEANNVEMHPGAVTAVNDPVSKSLKRFRTLVCLRRT